MAIINGTPGNDLIDELANGGSLTFADTVNTGGGNDVIQMYQNSSVSGITDTVNGGAGTDVLKFAIGFCGIRRHAIRASTPTRSTSSGTSRKSSISLC